MIAPNAPAVATLMRRWRHAARLNTAEAGRRLGLSGRSIEDIEQGRRRDGDILTWIALETLLERAEAQQETKKPPTRRTAA